MADERSREIQKKLQQGGGGVEDATQGLLYGARTKNVEMFIQAAVAGLKTFELASQRRFLREIASVVSDTTTDTRQSNSEEFKSTKAFEIHGPELGQVTPEELISILYDCVQDALIGKVNNNMSVTKAQTRNNHLYYSTPVKRSKSKKDILPKIKEAFSKYDGSFVVACSSPIRVYALHKAPTPEELEKRKKEREALRIQEKREEQEKALKDIKDKEQKLKEELKKLEQRQKRTEKSLEKYKENT